MAAGSDNIFPKLITAVQASDPAAPSNGDWKMYSKAGGIYARSSNSVVGPFAASSGGGGITSGTSNPGSPTNGDLFYRSDLDLLIRYRSSGTRWVCTCPHVDATTMQITGSILPMSVNASLYFGFDVTARDILVERVALSTFIPSGNSNGSHYWTVAVVNVTLGAGFDTQADGNTGTRHDITGGVVPTGTIYGELTFAKTGSPGALYVFPGGIIYRYIVT